MHIAVEAVSHILGSHGEMEVLAATMDMGQGAYTAYAQIVSEELGVPMERVKCYYPDTAAQPYAHWQRSEWTGLPYTLQPSGGNRLSLEPCHIARSPNSPCQRTSPSGKEARA
uniref:molybdopterin cofactor-binding domain-containing protein n=1 Tax=Acetomicrobium sp. S15 = DSM 107314 TaxID=2529858 RepID=UPI003158FB68